MAFKRRDLAVKKESVAPEQDPVASGAGEWLLRTEICLAQTSVVLAKMPGVQLSKFLSQGMANLCYLWFTEKGDGTHFENPRHFSFVDALVTVK